jgi:hypothetical protein
VGRTHIVAADAETVAIQAADVIRVAETSSATLWFINGSSVELSAGTVLEMSELDVTETRLRVRLTLLAGQTVNRVSRLLGVGDFYEVRTPSSVATVRGTIFVVSVVSEQETYVAVSKGQVAVNMAEQEVMVDIGEEVTAVVGQPLPYDANPHPAAIAMATNRASPS